MWSQGVGKSEIFLSSEIWYIIIICWKQKPKALILYIFLLIDRQTWPCVQSYLYLCLFVISVLCSLQWNPLPLPLLLVSLEVYLVNWIIAAMAVVVVVVSLQNPGIAVLFWQIATLPLFFHFLLKISLLLLPVSVSEEEEEHQ